MAEKTRGFIADTFHFDGPSIFDKGRNQARAEDLREMAIRIAAWAQHCLDTQRRSSFSTSSWASVVRALNADAAALEKQE